MNSPSPARCAGLFAQQMFQFQFIELFAPQALSALPLGELAKIGYSEPIFD